MDKAHTNRTRESAAVAGLTLLALVSLPLLAAAGAVVYTVLLVGLAITTLGELGRALGFQGS